MNRVRLHTILERATEQLVASPPVAVVTRHILLPSVAKEAVTAGARRCIDGGELLSIGHCSDRKGHSHTGHPIGARPPQCP